MEKARSVQERAFYSLCSLLVERVAAGARAGGVGVVDREALLLDGVDEVDDRAAEITRAHPVAPPLDAAEGGEVVTVERALVEEQLVTQARAAARLNGDAQLKIVAPLLVEEVLDLGRGSLGENDAGRGLAGRLGLAGVLDAHVYRVRRTRPLYSP